MKRGEDDDASRRDDEKHSETGAPGIRGRQAPGAVNLALG